MGRRAATITALILTAALFLALPGLWQNVMNQDRTSPLLKTPVQRTITVWLCPGGPEDRKWIHELLSQFEKEHKGARVYLRRVTADELYAENAVLPDVLLFATGEVNQPEGRLMPLAQGHASGWFAGKCYAVPLWYAQGEADQGVALQQAMFEQKGLDRPETSDLVRYAAICRDGPDARSLLCVLTGADPTAHGFRRFSDAAILPNAFAHTRQEILSICQDAYDRSEDPAKTLLRLR